MVGHSAGEFASAIIAGVFPLEDGLALVAERARLVGGLPEGAMLAVRLNEEQVRPYFADGIDLAAVNSRNQCVVSGPTEEIDRLARSLSDRRIGCRKLGSNHAFHSSMLDPILGEFTARVAEARRDRPSERYLSCVTGDWIDPDQVVTPGYWTDHLRRTVRFDLAAGKLARESLTAWVEVGPGKTLGTTARLALGDRPAPAILATLPDRNARNGDECPVMHESLGRLWELGLTPDWLGVRAGEQGRRVSLPAYPFERSRHWIEPGDQPELPAEAVKPAEPATPPSEVSTPSPVKRQLQECFGRLAGIPADQVRPDVNFLELGFDSLALTQAALDIRNRFGVRVSFRELLEQYSTNRKSVV